MPRLRRLSGQELVRLLVRLGFEVIRIRGSHHILRRVVIHDGVEEIQSINVPVHGSNPLATGMLKRLYRDLQPYLSEADLRDIFYTD